MELKLSRIKRFQQLTVLMGHGAQPEQKPPLPGILNQSIQHRLKIALAQRKGVDAAAVELGKQHQKTLQKGKSLPPPNGKIHKGIFTASGVTGKQMLF